MNDLIFTGTSKINYIETPLNKETPEQDPKDCTTVF